MDSKEDPNPFQPTEPTSYEDIQGKDLPSQKAQDKANRIISACTKERDLDQLIDLATSTGGLVNDQIRQVACTSREHQTLVS